VIHRLVREQVVAAAPEDVFEFFSRARNLETLTPPWLRFEVLTPEPIEMGQGTRIEYRLRLHGVPLRWVSRIEEWHPGRGFVDRQLRGPYRVWHHRHEFEPHVRGTLVHDIVHYSLPLGPLGALAHSAFVRRDLDAVFEYRRRQIDHLASAELLAA
jgi:ligand-binding SRPBCC domain-containing protein